ncbi:MAG TPA: LppP/LprE family lipoprotein, partial [Solirubrobacterales bacterium]
AGGSDDSPTSVAARPLKTADDVKTKVVTVTTPAPSPDQAPGPPPLSEALSEVEGQGYDVSDTSTYDASEPVAVLLGVKVPTADADRELAFFFADGRYLGTDTKDTSAGIRLAYQTGSTIALDYELYEPNDAMCCPSAGSVTVRFRWTGQQLVPLDPIPSDSSGASPSRR